MNTHNLSHELIEAQPRDFDFSQGFGDKWDIAFELTDDEIENEGYAPLMNYIYPLGSHFEVPDNVRNKLVNTTIVLIDGEYFLALTGGGMDLSWEICESYIRLGFYPPVHFCRLPPMAGRGQTDRDKHIVSCCNESLRTIVRWYNQRLKNNTEAFRP
jgi:hypothetical protein